LNRDTNIIVLSADKGNTTVVINTSVPIKDTLNIIKASHEVSSDLIPLIEHCLTTTYFSYNNATLGRYKCTENQTHTDRYLHAESHHHPVQKRSAINSLVYRVFTISDKEHLQIELNHLKLALQKNGHDKKDITKIINKHANKTAWEQCCDEYIEYLEGLKKPVLRQFVHVRAGYSAGLCWREIQTAFENRILTGAVINSNLIVSNLADSSKNEIVIECVQSIMQSYDSIKINIVFNGEFIAGDKRANKSITIRNQNYAEEGDNVQSMDNACFSSRLVATLYPAERHADWKSSYPHYFTVLNLTGIEFLMTLKNISKFEHLNAHQRVLYVQDPRNASLYHIAWIKNLSRLVKSQITENNNRIYFSSEKLQSYAIDYRKMNDCAIRARMTSSSNLETIITRNECRSSSTKIWSAFYGRRNPRTKMRRRTRINSTKRLV
ncbi:hypothetical protein ALC56_11636, partial [Trachymyrmex septentrionalis]